MAVQESDIQEVLDRLIRTDLSGIQTAGRVDQSQAFLELREILFTTLVIDPNAALALIGFARDRTLDATVIESDLALELQQALVDLQGGIVLQPFRTAQPLRDASSALLSLASNVTAGFTDTSAVDQANAALDVFLDEQLAPNVKSGGVPIVTIEESQKIITDLIPRLDAAHEETLRLVTQLELAFSEFTTKDLRPFIGAGLVSRARSLINSTISEISIDATASSADSTRHLATISSIKCTLRDFFQAGGPLDPRLVGDPSNSLRVRPLSSDFPETGTAATITTGIAVRPLVTVDTGAEVFEIDANEKPTTSVNLITQGLQSTAAELSGTVTETFNIAAGNRELLIAEDQTAPTSVTLALNGTATVQDIVDDINAIFSPDIASIGFLNGIPVVKLTSNTVGRNSHIHIFPPASNSANATLGFVDNTLVSGSDPALADIARALSSAQTEYDAEVVDDSPATTTLRDGTGSVSANVFTDDSAFDFQSNGVEAGDLLTFDPPTAGKENADEVRTILKVVGTDIHVDNLEDTSAADYIITKANKLLKLTSDDRSTASELTSPAGTISALLGFSGESARGITNFVQIIKTSPVPESIVDVNDSSVVIGDKLTISGVSATAVTIGLLEPLINPVSSLAEAVICIDPGVVVLFNNFAESEFSIDSFGAISFRAFVDEPIDTTKLLPTFLDTTLLSNRFNEDLSKLKEALFILANDPTDSGKQTTAKTLADALVDLLDNTSGLQFVLNSLVLPESPQLDQLIDALLENNMDRLVTLLSEGFLEQGLNVTASDVSFAGALQKATQATGIGGLNV